VQDSLQPGEWLEYQIDWIGVRRLVWGEKVECQPVPSECQPVPSECQPVPSECQPGPSENFPIRNKYPVPVPDRVFERKQYRTGTGTGAERPRLLDGLTLGALANTGEMLRLLNQVCELSPIAGLTTSEADRHWWLMCAECALRAGTSPVKYFRWLVQGSAIAERRKIPTCDDLDAAAKRLEGVEACPA
jgi:hypothetical protein